MKKIIGTIFWIAMSLLPLSIPAAAIANTGQCPENNVHTSHLYHYCYWVPGHWVYRPVYHQPAWIPAHQQCYYYYR